MDITTSIQQHSQRRLTALVKKRNADQRLTELADEMARHEAESERADKEAREAEAAIEALRPLMEDDSNGG